jgi:hypothetical protein
MFNGHGQHNPFDGLIIIILFQATILCVYVYACVHTSACVLVSVNSFEYRIITLCIDDSIEWRKLVQLFTQKTLSLMYIIIHTCFNLRFMYTNHCIVFSLRGITLRITDSPFPHCSRSTWNYVWMCHLNKNIKSHFI